MEEQSMTITSQFDNLREVAGFARRCATEYGMRDEDADDVELAVDEAVTNVIEHGYRGNPAGLITVTCARRKKELVVEIRDNGEPFDLTKYRDPKTAGSLSDRSVGGLGLFFMKKLMDRVEFHHDRGKGNLTVMVKKVK